MLEQHIGQRTVTPETLGVALKNYINAADPSHVYLLDSEAQPFINMSTAQLAEAVKQYQNDNYTLFIQLNDAMQRGIFRARQLRHFSDSERTSLYQDAAQRYEHDLSVEGESNLNSFARDERELVHRLKDQFVDYAMAQMDRFGVKDVMKHQDVVTAKFESHLQKSEGDYLYTGAHSEPLSASEQDNLFSMHILKALAKSLDAHSSFFDNGEAQDMKMRLEKGYEGVGIVISEVIDGFVISDLMADSPAQRSGQVMIHDRLLQVNGHPVMGLTLQEVVHGVRDHGKGEPVSLELQRKDKSGAVKDIYVTLKPEMIVVNSDRVDTSFEKYQDGIIGRITLHAFYEGPKGISAAQDVSDAIVKLQKQGKVLGLVLDLRDNSGGYLSQAVKVAGLFMPSGVVVMAKYNNGEEHIYRDVDGTAAYTGPLVVLTSKLTASAAEIVASALQDYGLAVVVGDAHTYGKGTIQAQTVTEGNASEYFKVTVGKYYTVSGHTTQLRGVLADIPLPGEYSQLAIGESYLDGTVANDDAVPSEYQDNLEDIDPRARSWYQEHYLPVLQAKETVWQSMVPELKRRSEERVGGSPQYQLFLKRLAELAANQPIESSEIDLANFDINAYQVHEATQVLQDMISLHNQSQQTTQANPRR